MLTVSESARMLNVTPSRVRALIAQGMLPARKVGRAWVLEEADVMERASKRVGPGRPARKAVVPVEDSQPKQDCSSARRQELHRLYLDCKREFCFRPSVEELMAAHSAEEASFYVAVADFFLQEKQRELVAQGVY